MRTVVRIACLLLLLPLFAYAQTFRYIGVENGLSNRRVFSLQQDSTGYMWFLNSDGIDRYNGKNFKHYPLGEEQASFTFPIHQGWIWQDRQGTLWVVGKNGNIFRYDKQHDRFKRLHKSAGPSATISYSYMDRTNHIWLCYSKEILLYDTQKQEIRTIPNLFRSEITAIEQQDEEHFFIGTSSGIRHCCLHEGRLQMLPQETLDAIRTQVSTLYLHSEAGKLFIGTYGRGVFTYDINGKTITDPHSELEEVNITRIKPLTPSELLIATEGMGLYKIDVNTCLTTPYLNTDHERYNGMNGNNISDLHVDKEKRIWLINYPFGITLIDNRYTNYNWIKHSVGNGQSLVNDRVHAIIEDSEGDLWFGTSNGISLYRTRSRQWHTFLNQQNSKSKNRSQTFLTLCEVAPGTIWAGGYSPGIYRIDKAGLSVDHFLPGQFTPDSIRPDKHIRAITKDSAGDIWLGGYYNLKRMEPRSNRVRLYPGINYITAIIDNDDHHLWVGTSAGLYLLEKESGNYTPIELQEEIPYINSLYQSEGGLLYIGTNGAGLYIYNHRKKSFTHYHKDNCALVSNNIYTILPETDGIILMSTENGISGLNVKGKVFHNWTKEQGLLSSRFSAASGTIRRNKNFIFGSTSGAVEFPAGTRMPGYTYSPMIFSNFRVSYKEVYSNESGSPLKQDINDSRRLDLSYFQNTFGFKVSAINYDAPDNALFYWKFKEKTQTWSRVPEDGMLRFINLAPGRYTLQVRAVSKEEPYKYFEERELYITVAQPLWLSHWAFAGYLLIIILIFVSTFRFMILRKQKRISDEKTRFFITTAHDIRTPLTLIKAPLEEALNSGHLEEKESDNLSMALRNANSLLQMATNLINLERAVVHSSKLSLAEYNLHEYLQDIYHLFHSYAASKHITLTYESDFRELYVCFDKEKMDSILKNILSNAMKYTPEHGQVSITAREHNAHWSIDIKDSGIGIPSREQRKLFRLHFRGSNAVNLKISGSGIGLILVRKLVKMHQGKICIESVEQQGTTVKMIFPKAREASSSATPATPVNQKESIPVMPAAFHVTGTAPKPAAETEEQEKPRLLVVEDNDGLRNYLTQLLGREYIVRSCTNGKEALVITPEFRPDLILSDIMMPQMGGDELCRAIKNDLATSHIPVLLLTALGEEKHILDGLQIGADDYIVKPFNVNILKASIANLLHNRALLRRKYANFEIDNDLPTPLPECSTPLDWQFMNNVKKKIEEQLDNTDFTVDTLCSALHMSRTSFYNKLKALTGEAPAVFVRNYRLKRAADLLQENRMSVTEIAERTGFNDTKYLREVFKKRYGISPSQYRQEKGHRHG
ncbi:MAG: response regulator [Bacteroides sp.]|nr:response regulator [Bacteroides sp.]